MDNPETIFPDTTLFKIALAQKCPRCGKGDLYKPGKFTTMVNDKCSHCDMALADNDSADAPAVFLIFVLGFLIVPASLLMDKLFSPPMWVQVLVWGIIAVAITIGALRPLKAYVIALQFKHRPGDWSDK